MIRAREVRLIGADGEQIGILGSREALEIARGKGLDLVEVAVAANPPVCRIMDYGRFVYEQRKKAQEARKKQHHVQVKEVKVRPNIDDHDLGFKVRNAEKFLRAGDKVKITVMFRGRENARPQLGSILLERIVRELGEICTIDSAPRKEGRNMSMLVSPNRRVLARPGQHGPVEAGGERGPGGEVGATAGSRPTAGKAKL